MAARYYDSIIFRHKSANWHSHALLNITLQLREQMFVVRIDKSVVSKVLCNELMVDYIVTNENEGSLSE